MLKDSIPFILTSATFANSGSFQVDYQMADGTGFQAMSADFDPTISIMDELMEERLNAAKKRILPHLNHFINNVPHAALYGIYRGVDFGEDVEFQINSILPGGDFHEDAPFGSFPQMYGDYAELELGIYITSVSFNLAQTGVTFKCKKTGPTSASPFGGADIDITLSINLKDHYSAKKYAGYLFYEVLIRDLTVFQDICFEFVQVASQLQSRQLDLFRQGDYHPLSGMMDDNDGDGVKVVEKSFSI